MYCPEKQKYNRFELVDIPSNRDLFFRLGSRIPETNMHSGETELPQTMSKTDALAAAALQAEEEFFKSDKTDALAAAARQAEEEFFKSDKDE